MERLLKKLIISLIGFGILLLVGNLLVDNPYSHRFLQNAINEKSQKYTNLNIKFQSAKVHVLPPGIELYNLEIAGTNAPDRPIITAAQAKAQLSLLSLILGKLRLSLISGEDLTIVWPPPWGFPGFLKQMASKPLGSEPPLQWPLITDLPVERIVLENAQIFAEFPAFDGIPHSGKWLTLDSQATNLDLSLDSIDDIDGQIDIGNFNLALGANSLLENSSISTEFKLKQGKISTNLLKLTGERLSLDQAILTGEILTHGSDRRLDGIKLGLGGRTRGNLSLLGSILDLANTHGKLAGDLRAEVILPIGSDSLLGSDVRYSAEGELQLEDGVLDDFRLYDSTVSFRLNQDKIVFPDIDLAIDGQSYGHIRGQILFDDKISFDFGGQPQKLRLEDLLAIFAVDFRSFDLALSSSDLIVRGTGDPLDIEIAATVLGRDIHLAEQHVKNNEQVFKQSPDCFINLNMNVSKDEINFNKTKANCFQTSSENNLADSTITRDIKPPSGSYSFTQLIADGKIYTSRNAIDLKIEIPEIDIALAQYFSQLRLAGEGTGFISISGPFDNILFDVKSTINNATPIGIPLGTITSSLTIKSDQIVLHEAIITPKDGGSLKISDGKLNLDHTLNLSFSAEANAVSSRFIRDIFQAAQIKPNINFGFERLKAQLSGPLLHPLSWQGKAELTLDNVSLDEELILDRLQASLISDLRGIRIQDALATKNSWQLGFNLIHQRSKAFNFEQAAASTNFWTRLGIEPSDRIAIDFATPELKTGKAPSPDHLGQLPYIGPLLVKAGIASQIAVQGRISGPVDNLQGSFTGKLHQISIFRESIPEIEVRGFINRSKLDLTFSHLGSVAEGRISAEIMQPGIPYEWFINLNGLDIRAFASQYFYADPRNFAYVTATWSMKGKLLDWWRSSGELFVKDIRAKYVRDISGQTRTLSLKQSSPVKLLFSPNGWRFENDKDLLLEGKYIAMRLSLPDCRPPERLSLKLDTNIDLGIARDFSTLIDTASGKINVVAEIVGPVSDPDLVVEITDIKPESDQETTWQNVSLGVTEVRPALKDIQMRVFYAGGRLVIDHFTATKGTGSIRAAGTISLDPRLEDQSHLDINLDNATFITSVAFLKSFEMQMSGNLALTGSSFPYRLAGDLTVMRARSTKEVDIRTEIINALRASSIIAPMASERALLELDLNVTADRSINIQNRSIQTALSSNLQIRGTDAQPSVTGQVDVDKGKFTYKRDFNIERGIVSFDDPIKIDPALDILAVSEVNDYRVYISISGRASQPVIEFAADPPTRENGSPISKVEILILLSRGTLPEENRSIGETQGAATSEALNLIMGQFEEPVEKLFDLSGQKVVRNIYFDTYPSNEGNPVPRLNLPLELGKDFDLVLRTDPSTEEVSGEYNLHENINFSASWERKHATEESQDTNQSGDTKLNLKFRFNFE